MSDIVCRREVDNTTAARRTREWKSSKFAKGHAFRSLGVHGTSPIMLPTIFFQAISVVVIVG